ncbi:MAG: hypothetical protein ABI665_00970 [Vicinamibacterales bacterium]
MIADLIVLSALALSAAFVVVWAVRPGLRERIERPKYQFLDAVEGYDRAQAGMLRKGVHPRE